MRATSVVILISIKEVAQHSLGCVKIVIQNCAARSVSVVIKPARRAGDGVEAVLHGVDRDGVGNHQLPGPCTQSGLVEDRVEEVRLQAPNHQKPVQGHHICILPLQ